MSYTACHFLNFKFDRYVNIDKIIFVIYLFRGTASPIRRIKVGRKGSTPVN